MSWANWIETDGWRYYFYEEVAALALNKEIKKGLYQRVLSSRSPDEAREILAEFASVRIPRKERIQ